VSASITSVILCHRALLHQQPDDVDRALGHAVGEFLDGDGMLGGGGCCGFRGLVVRRRLGRAGRGQARGFRGLARGGFVGLALFFLAAAGFLGGGEDGDLFLFAAFGLALGGDALLFQHALAGGDLAGVRARGAAPGRR
jgi:hypothetical protein